MKTKNLLFACCYLFIHVKLQAQFTPGNLVVMQAGDGTTALAGTGNQIILKEFNTSGSVNFSVSIPNTGTNALITRGNAVAEGYISRSADNNYIVFGGYKQSLPNSNVLNTTAASSINRGIGMVDANGNYILAATCSVSSLASGDIRGAAATNSANVWASSSSQGLSYYGSASAASNVQNGKTNLRAANIFNNQLFISSQVATGTPTDIGIYAVGSGTPTNASQLVTTTIHTGTSSQPGQFYFNNAGNVCYVADARNSAGGGIQKWVMNAGNWTLAYTLPTGTANIGAFGVVADFSGLNPKVYATTTEGTYNRLIAVNDMGANSTATTLATANSSNTIFRGLAWSPGTSTCVPVSVTSTNHNAPICSSQSLNLNVNATGTGPISFSWTGTGVFNSNSTSNPSIIHSSSGTYSVIISNACGTTTAAINVSVNPSPTLLINSASICSGGVATISANGANTYTWSNGLTSTSFTASPSVFTSYTLNGQSSAGCSANTVTTSINVVSSPSLSINSTSICLGASATLSAQGASSYTWSNLTYTNAVIVVTPTTNTQYTVSGNASGCPNTVSIVATVIVNALPSVSITNTQKMVCLKQNSLSLTAIPLGGNFSGSHVIGNAFITPTVIGNYLVIYTYTDSNNCSNTVSETFSVNTSCLGFDEHESVSVLRFYPNPTSQFLNIENNQKLPIKIVIKDNLLRTVKEQIVDEQTMVLDLENLERGLYYLFMNENNKNCVKFIKQ